MDTHPITLAFRGENQEIEKQFQDHYFTSSLNQIRVVLLIGAAFFLIYSLIDMVMVPEKHYLFLTLRAGICLPVCLLLFWFTSSRHARSFLQPAISLGIVAGGTILIYMLMATPEANRHVYLKALVQLLFAVYTLTKIRFIWASASFLLVNAIFIGWALFFSDYTPDRLITDVSFLMGLNLLGMVACYSIELYARKTFFLSLQLNIQERKLSEKALAESEERFKTIFETTTAGMIIVNGLNQTIEEINPAAAQMIGEPEDRIKGLSITELFHPLSPGEDACLNDPVAIDPVERQLTSQKKGAIPVLKTTRPLTFRGEPKWMISFIDIQRVKEAETIKREAEIQLTRSQHLQTIGTLAGGISHDFNNILYGITGYATLALDDAPQDSLLKNNINEILRGSRRAKELIAQIMAFSRQETTEKKVILLAPLVQEALKLIRASISAAIHIKTDIRTPDQAVLANPTQIHQVIINLCTNAAHAIGPKGGFLHVILDTIRLNAEWIDQEVVLTRGNYARIRIIDNGKGMEESVQRRIFEPFFTTKPPGEGVGMGLSVVMGVIQSHNGGIRVQSEPGKGASFELLLPSAEECNPSEHPEEGKIHGGGEHILLVDDEPSIIRMSHQMLSRMGYHVTALGDPREAVTLFEKESSAFDLVITDLTMPGMEGTALARKLTGIKPGIPVILCTGYNDQIPSEQMTASGIREIILKPILREDLASAIRRLLDEQGE